MKKILLTLGLSIAAIAMSFNGISQSGEASAKIADATEVAHKCEKDCKKACCAKADSKKACTSADSKKACAAKCSKTKTAGVAGTKQEAKTETAAKSCSKSSKKGACCASKSKGKEAKVENTPTEVKMK